MVLCFQPWSLFFQTAGWWCLSLHASHFAAPADWTWRWSFQPATLKARCFLLLTDKSAFHLLPPLTTSVSGDGIWDESIDSWWLTIKRCQLHLPTSKPWEWGCCVFSFLLKDLKRKAGGAGFKMTQTFTFVLTPLSWGLVNSILRVRPRSYVLLRECVHWMCVCSFVLKNRRPGERQCRETN